MGVVLGDEGMRVVRVDEGMGLDCWIGLDWIGLD